MKKIFLLTLLILITACDNSKDNDINSNGMLAPIGHFCIRLVDTKGNWIESVEEKEMQLLVADSNWNPLDPQPENYSYSLKNPFYLWSIKKKYNYTGNGKDEFIGGKKELLLIEVGSGFKSISNFDYINDKTFGDYVVLKIDENTSLNIQLFYKEFFNRGECIEKFVCNGKEYINIEYVNPYDPDPRNRALIQKINDIVIE